MSMWGTWHDMTWRQRQWEVPTRPGPQSEPADSVPHKHKLLYLFLGELKDRPGETKSKTRQDKTRQDVLGSAGEEFWEDGKGKYGWDLWDVDLRDWSSEEEGGRWFTRDDLMCFICGRGDEHVLISCSSVIWEGEKERRRQCKECLHYFTLSFFVRRLLLDSSWIDRVYDCSRGGLNLL